MMLPKADHGHTMSEPRETCIKCNPGNLKAAATAAASALEHIASSDGLPLVLRGLATSRAFDLRLALNATKD